MKRFVMVGRKIAIPVIGIVLVLGGIFLEDWFRFARILMTVSGVVLLLACFVYTVQRYGGVVCPGCGMRHVVNRPQLAMCQMMRKKPSWFWRCPRCGTLIEMGNKRV